MTFALGGMAYWVPTFLARQRHLPLDEANALFGGMTVVSGLLGTFLGGWLGDGLLKRTDKAYLLVSGWGMILAVLLPVAAAWRLEWSWIWAALLMIPFVVLGGVVLLTNSR